MEKKYAVKNVSSSEFQGEFPHRLVSFELFEDAFFNRSIRITQYPEGDDPYVFQGIDIQPNKLVLYSEVASLFEGEKGEPVSTVSLSDAERAKLGDLQGEAFLDYVVELLRPHVTLESASLKAVN